jgi:hypothetical protein
VAFKIKTKNNLTLGDSLKNKANIYFDYNLPVKTNTALTKFSAITAVGSKFNNNDPIEIYPNPSCGNFIINFIYEDNYPIDISIYDITGKLVYMRPAYHSERSQLEIYTNDMPAGIYNIRLSANNEVWNKKIVIVSP